MSTETKQKGTKERGEERVFFLDGVPTKDSITGEITCRGYELKREDAEHIRQLGIELDRAIKLGADIKKATDDYSDEYLRLFGEKQSQLLIMVGKELPGLHDILEPKQVRLKQAESLH